MKTMKHIIGLLWTQILVDEFISARYNLRQNSCSDPIDMFMKVS